MVVCCHIVPKAAGIIYHSSHSHSLTNAHKCMLHSMGAVRLLSSSFSPFHRAESILLSPPIIQLPFVVLFVDYFMKYTLSMPYPQIHLYIGTTFGSSTASTLNSDNFRRYPMHMRLNGASKTLIRLIEGVFPNSA